MNVAALPIITARDYEANLAVRWCPGCGNFAVLAQLKQALAQSGCRPEQTVFISGAGCASRLPYYLNTYGFHSMPGRAFAIATGLKSARPDLSVWVATGDGDAFGPGAGHLLHALRRNVDIKILLLNNEILGLSKGQASPTTKPGTRSRTTPAGAIDSPLRPAAWALAAGATFVARTSDADMDHFHETILRAARHSGTAFVEVYQNCNVFNDGAFAHAADRASRADTTLQLAHARPLIFGRDRNRGIRLEGLALQAVSIGEDVPLDDILVHDESCPTTVLADLLSRMNFPDLPECFGVFRAVDRPANHDSHRLSQNLTQSLQELLAGEDTWTVS